MEINIIEEIKKLLKDEKIGSFCVFDFKDHSKEITAGKNYLIENNIVNLDIGNNSGMGLNIERI